MAGNFDEWAAVILSNYPMETGWTFAHDWQQKNGPLPMGAAPPLPWPHGRKSSTSGAAVEDGQTVEYSSTPISDGDNPIPQGVTLQGKGSGGFNLNTTVLNPPGR
jgi:hypothetical protein